MCLTKPLPLLTKPLPLLNRRHSTWEEGVCVSAAPGAGMLVGLVLVGVVVAGCMSYNDHTPFHSPAKKRHKA